MKNKVLLALMLGVFVITMVGSASAPAKVTTPTSKPGRYMALGGPGPLPPDLPGPSIDSVSTPKPGPYMASGVPAPMPTCSGPDCVSTI